MHSTSADPSSSRTAQPTALVIEPVLPHLLSMLSVLASLGFDTTVAETYQDAKSALYAQRFTLLVTGVKLREYNGLQLVLRGTSSWPHLAAIVTSEGSDPVLEVETERLGATFVVMPAPARELEAAICRTVLAAQQPPEARTPVRAPFERRAGHHRVTAEGLREPASERRRDVVAALRALAGSG